MNAPLPAPSRIAATAPAGVVRRFFRGGWSFERILLLAVLLINLAAGYQGWARLAEGRSRAEERAAQETRNLAQVLEQSLGSTARSIDVTLRAVVDELEAAAGGAHALRTEGGRDMLARYKSWLPEIEGLRVFDAEGRPRWARAGAPPGQGLIGAEAFRTLAGLVHDQLMVSPPQIEADSGVRVLSFSRRYRLPDGRFGGVVTAAVPLHYLEELLAVPRLGSKGLSMLRYEDRSLIAVQPPIPGEAGQVGNKAISAELTGILDSGLQAASYLAPHMKDGVERINSVRRVAGLPFLLVLGMASEEYLAEWRDDLRNTLALLTVFLLLTAGSAWLVIRYHRRLQAHAARLGETLAELRDRDKVLRVTERVGGLGVFSIDSRSGSTRFSEQFLQVFGLPPGRPFPVEVWQQGIHPDDREETLARAAEVSSPAGRAFDHEYRYLWPDGQVRWIHGLAEAERDVEGQSVRVHGAVRDVTDRHRAEISLKAALDEYERLVARIPVGVFKIHWTQDGRPCFDYVSPLFCEQCGLDEAAVLADATTVYLSLHEDDRASFDAMCHRVVRTLETFEWEGRIRAGGRLLWISVQARPTRMEDGSVMWEGIQSDVTGRKLAELALRESEEHARLLLRHSPVGILKYDNDLKVSYCNQQFARIMGAPLDYMLRLDCSKLQDVRVLSPLREAIAGNIGRYEGPYRTTYNGHDLNIAMHCAPLRDEAGAIVGGIAILEDITERMLKDQELARYRDSLEELVDERTADLVAARAEAERLARVKSEFLANMSHEIRTPLNGVLGLAHIGYRDSRGRDKARDTFARILSSGQLLLGIINDILDFSKIESGKLRVESIPVDLGKVIGGALELMEERASAKGLILRFRRSASLPESCLSDPLRIGQILINLLSNAIKFTDHGEVSLAAGLEGERLLFQVTDSGIGMSEGELAKVFAPFEQADNSTTRKFGGTGLGLTITRRIVELMGGAMVVHSRPGEGSCFEVRLPCVPAALLPPPEAPPPRPGAMPGDRRLAGLSLLVAEDNEVNRMVLEELLGEEGATVTLACNGQEAVDAVRGQGMAAFDAVLMDVQMPVMDGFDATRAIHELAPRLPVIGQTAHALDEERERCFAAGMVDHLAKPIDPERLVEVVRRHAAAPLRFEGAGGAG
ncbi:ATP-binding protein [Zoogloea dura]|uniref:Virulence sensor protein BvgS n=1 Tax=Zoogloea dura TaxID=2728840 RepID=A0A848G390_9RHOO|nr:ATP-binding protein [Zoogloea dura]NML25692.1 PAS domain S-box protein [Zoogloea dura]